MDESYQPPTQNNNNNNQQQYGKPAAFFAGPATIVDPAWYADTGATNHVTAELENLKVGNNKCLEITHIDSTVLPSSVKSKALTLSNVLRVPFIKKYC